MKSGDVIDVTRSLSTIAFTPGQKQITSGATMSSGTALVSHFQSITHATRDDIFQLASEGTSQTEQASLRTAADITELVYSKADKRSDKVRYFLFFRTSPHRYQHGFQIPV